MEEYLEKLIIDVFGVRLNSAQKEKCLFEFDFSVERVLFIIYEFSKKFNINIICFQEEINLCSYNEILSIGKDHCENS